MHPHKITALDLEHKMNEFFKLGLKEIAEQYYKAAQIVYSMMSEDEYSQE